MSHRPLPSPAPRPARLRRVLLGAALAVVLGSTLATVQPVPALAKDTPWCADYRRVSKDKSLETALTALGDSELITKNPAKAKVSIRKVIVVFRDLQKNAPAKIKPDLKSIEQFFVSAEVFIDKYSNAKKDPKAAVKAATDIANSVPTLQATVARLQKFTLSECGLS